MLQNNLGIAYRNRIRGKKAENMENAIAAYKAALQVWTREAFPDQWAMLQNNLAVAYNDRILGERAQNLEIALAACQAVLSIRTKEKSPEKWGNTQNTLGGIYYDRICGNRAQNLENGIAALQAALQVYTYDAFPQEWARVQHNLGNVYRERIKGERAENLETAIMAFQSALKVYTKDYFPELRATIQNALGVAYCHRIHGEKNQNLEDAITTFQAALDVYTRDAFPQKWAVTQNNLGNVYCARIEGDRAKNLDTAIASYQAALQVRTREAFPEQWAETQNNLGTAYYERIEGNKTQNLDRAIQCYQAALQVRTREGFPKDWAMTQYNLGNAYTNQGQMAEAITCYRSALEIYQPFIFPVECLRAGRELGNRALFLERWSEAIEGYALAIKAVETSRSWAKTDTRRQQILAEAIDIYENMVQACINAGQIEKAFEYAERSRSKRLVDLMASNDLYFGGEIPPEVQHYLQQYEDLQHQIDRERSQNNSGNNRELSEVGRDRAAFQAYSKAIATLESQKQQVWEQIRRLDPVLAGEIQVSAPDFEAMQKLIDRPTTAILSFYTTSNDIHIFVLRQNTITLHTATGQGLNELQNWIFQNWLKPYIEEQNTWQSQIGEFLTELSQRLQITEVISQHLEGIDELILVPHLALHQIPLAALPIGSDRYLGDKFLIRYTPSCQILQFCQQRGEVKDTLTYGTIEDATEDLPFASFEGEQIAQLYNIPDSQRLKGRSQATVSNYRQLAKQVQVIHSSHHAQSRIDQPLESVLKLADGTITLGQLLTPGWRLPQLSDVFLSCCETGLGVTEIADDIFTLSTGFLCAGARSVVSTLWSVDDLATAIFSMFYYQYRQQGKSRTEALQQAQIKLRSLAGNTLSTHYKPHLAPLLEAKFKQAESDRKAAQQKRDTYPKDSPAYLQWEQECKERAKLANRIRKAQKHLEEYCQKSFPFSHPVYWAAFICAGLH
ncbi:MAG TPA: hypothetical protein DDW76_14435 [Cyanobacteria bacterium UBA11369]|nr:hypothetical protein [Cyanobacteria bacterium UBA11371]HBE34154.1 hypothetical protein [Cyanobacteria bacterium UBA11368]HBE49956.1 hypothetical protein [Cyanobacteria bacterium UBA11369]